MAGLLSNGQYAGEATYKPDTKWDPLAEYKEAFKEGQGGTWSGDRYYTDKTDPTTGLPIVHDFSVEASRQNPNAGWTPAETQAYNNWNPGEGVNKNIANYSIATGTAIPSIGRYTGGGDLTQPWNPTPQSLGNRGNTINSWDAYGLTPGQPIQMPQAMPQQTFSGGGSSQQASVAPSGLLAADTPTSYQATAFTPEVTTQANTRLGSPSAAQVYLNHNPDVAAAYSNLTQGQINEWFGGTRPTADQFAQTHFNANGQREGRKWGYDNLSNGTTTGGTGTTGGGGTSGQTGGTTNTGIQQAPVTPSSSSQYFQNYPELKAVWDGMTPDQKAEYGNNPDQFARTHYQKFGRQEGRTFGNANAAQQYFQLYPEVKAAWDALTTAQKAEYGNNAEQFAWTHYLKYGKAERRENPWGSDGYTNNGSTYDANTERWMVNADQTVEGRLAGLLDDDNPLVQMARTRGMQDASARGLLNSSLGAQAGALAAYQYAMPIAQADATTYASAARQNASEQTNANLANANARTGRGNLEYSTQANIDQQNRVLASQQAHDKDIAGINNDAQMARLNAQIEATYRQNEQNIDANFRTSYRAQLGNLQSQYAQMYSAIQSSDIPPDQKTAQLAQLDTFYDNYHVLIGNIFTSTGDMSRAFAAIPPPTREKIAD